MKIGFIGLGIMGSRMAANLIKGNYQVSVYNRSREKADHILEAGAIWADFPKNLAANSDVIITMLANPEVVEAVALGENGFLKVPGEGRIWVDCSTVNPSFAKNMASKASLAGYRFLEAPVAGTKAPAESGELVFFVGGEEQVMAKVQPLFDLMGKKTIPMGTHGQGASIKMIVNLMLAQTMVAFSEGMALGQSLGIPQDKLLNIMLNVPVVPPYLAALRGKIESNHFEANFPMRLMKKDLHLVAQSAHECGIAMPTTNLVKELFAMGLQEGWADEDFSAIYKLFNSQST